MEEFSAELEKKRPLSDLQIHRIPHIQQVPKHTQYSMFFALCCWAWDQLLCVKHSSLSVQMLDFGASDRQEKKKQKHIADAWCKLFEDLIATSL